MRTIDELIWHCSATREGDPVTAGTVRTWHTSPDPNDPSKPWSDIGYHGVVELPGNFVLGRPYAQAGAHVKEHNATTIGYCYIGGLSKDGAPKDTRTAGQKETMLRVTREAIEMFPTIRKISGHYEYANKACPCFNPSAEYSHLLVERVLETIELVDVPVVEAFRYPSHGTFVRALPGGIKLPLRAYDSSGLFTNPVGGEQRWYCVIVEGQELWLQPHDIRS